jgi:hypothetical protein
VTRRVLAEVLAEKMDRGELLEEHALRLGRQILRENALAWFPKLREWLWKRGAPAGTDGGKPGLAFARGTARSRDGGIRS